MKRFLQHLTARYKALRSGSSVGKRTVIHPGAVLERRKGSIEIGARCEVHRGVQLLAYGVYVGVPARLVKFRGEA